MRYVALARWWLLPCSMVHSNLDQQDLKKVSYLKWIHVDAKIVVPILMAHSNLDQQDLKKGRQVLILICILGFLE